MILLSAATFLFGTFLALYALDSAIRTFVLPRGQNVILTGLVFRALRGLLSLFERLLKDEHRREGLWALYAPFALLILPFIWLLLIEFGFTLIFWAVGVRPLADAFLLSGSSLLTLGFYPVSGTLQTVLAFLDAALGLVMIALLIAYLPTMYSAFSRRETLVAKLEVYAGAPASPMVILGRMHRINGMDDLKQLFELWETWFAEIEESQTSFAPLNFFRSPKPHRSWVTAAGAVLDAASLRLAAVDLPFEPRAALCIRSGYLALRHIADFFGFRTLSEPTPGDPILITRSEFERALDQLAEEGLAIKPDRDQAWLDFAGWRVNYDESLVALAYLTKAPEGVWSSDRVDSAPAYLLQPARFRRKKENKADGK